MTQSSDSMDWDALDALYAKARKADLAGEHEAAVALYRQVLALDGDDHVGASLHLARLTGETPSTAPSAYVATLFDQTAECFDTILVDELGYGVPLLIADGLTSLNLGPFGSWLDLGCGTGLCAMALEDRITQATGVDLAPTMIEIAAELDIYQELYTAEAVAFLASEAAKGPYNLVTAADVLPYLGALEPLFTALAPHVESDSILCLSSELGGPGTDYSVGPHKRFAHSSAYVAATLSAFGWQALRTDTIMVRREQDDPVIGELVFARKS